VNLLLTLLSLAQAAIFVPVAGSRDITLALPLPQAPAGDANQQIIYDTIRKDLEITGYFRMLDPASFIEKGKGIEPGTFNFGDWTTVGAASLAKTRLLPKGDPSCDPAGKKMCMEVYVYYVVEGTKLAGKRLHQEGDNPRMLAHRAAEVILTALTGETGFFLNGQIAAVGQRTGSKEIYIISLDGHGVTPVTRNGSINLSPAWSPDGGRLAWTSFRRGNPDLYIKDLASASTAAISAQRGLNAAPAFSPDGRTLALTRSANGDSDIYLIDARSGREIRRLTTGGGIDVAPNFSPDGRTVIFSSERSGGSQVFAVSTEGGEPRRITRQGGSFTDPVYSPDGSRIAFVGRNGRFDIYVCDADGSNLTRITQDAGDNEDPSWSPDGKYIAFSSTRSGRSEIWVSTANGAHQVQISTGGGWTQPTWKP
jgi:TolB protein